MDKMIVGGVTKNERDEILKLHERRTALKELFLTLGSPHLSVDEQTMLKDKIVEDLAKADSQYEAWWRERAKQYNWVSRKHGQWMLDFETREVSFQVGDCSSSPGDYERQFGVDFPLADISL